VADVAGREDARQTGLEEHRRPVERPPQFVRRYVGAREDVAAVVSRERTVEPLSVRLCADHHVQRIGRHLLDRPVGVAGQRETG